MRTREAESRSAGNGMGKGNGRSKGTGTETGRLSRNGKAAGTGLDGVQVALAPGGHAIERAILMGYATGKKKYWRVVMKDA